MSFFNELKRRNVFRVAIAYVIATWLLGWLRTRQTENGIRFQCDPRVQDLGRRVGLPPPIHPVSCD